MVVDSLESESMNSTKIGMAIITAWGSMLLLMAIENLRVGAPAA